ncbi:MAG: hypothetical protein AUJ72_00190 [Candidatus Omnitrophica bacterium CG1_02_46_14]|nr:MAG: hypothetical protein AUJ72_00190 [Candidatus Omnitrophica bacterium CG1_02_46_14]
MARAFISKELYFEIKNETGLLGQITKMLEMAEVFIIHLSAYTLKNKGYFQIITKDNKKAKEILKHLVPKIIERDVLIVEFENKVGTLAPVARLLGSNGIGINTVYGTSGDGFKIVGVFTTNNNENAVQIINKDSGTLGV